MAADLGEASFKNFNKVNDFDARSADETRDDTHRSFMSSHREEDEEEKENEVH